MFEEFVTTRSYQPLRHLTEEEKENYNNYKIKALRSSEALTFLDEYHGRKLRRYPVQFFA